MAAVVSARDWASLPSPLLCSVAERLIPVAFARIRAVCSHWASAVSPEEWEEGQQRPYYLPRSPNCPWLVVPTAQDESTGSITFLSLPESLRPYRLTAPELVNKRMIGSHAGWLATVDAECNMSLINPLTRAQIPLPSITTLPAVSVDRDPASGAILNFVVRYPLVPVPAASIPVEFFEEHYIIKIILSSNPSTSDDYVVVLIFGAIQRQLLFARPGDTAWCPVLKYSVPQDCSMVVDAVFVGRKLYTVVKIGEIRCIDFSEPAKPQLTVIAKRRYKYTTPYLAFSPESNDLLQIFRVYDQEDVDAAEKTVKFIVEKVDLQGEATKSHIAVENLGCRAIFLGINQTFLVSTDGISGLRPNCIYFTADDWEDLSNYKHDTLDVGVYDLKEDTCQPLYPPDAWLNWPPPIWFSPISF